MSLEDLGIIGYEANDDTLLIDGDLIVFRCSVITDLNFDDDRCRRIIAKNINRRVDVLLEKAKCSKYIMFVTTKHNFRDQLVDDYKYSREELVRPINLAWAKRWAVDNLNTHYHKGMEADDLLAVHQKDDTIIWSDDKDLMQVPGRHLLEDPDQIVTVSEEGCVKPAGKKFYFDGNIGLYFQMLTGDSTDYIIGCGKRVTAVYGSKAAKAGQEYIKRVGVGPGAAYKLVEEAIKDRGEKSPDEAVLEMVCLEYAKLHGEGWQEQLETQANLLFMVRKQYGEVIQRWTYDGREEYFDLVKGVIVNDCDKEAS